MKKLVTIFAVLAAFIPAWGQNTLEIKETQIPLLIEREDNVLLMMRMSPVDARQLKDITLEFPEGTPLRSIKSVKLYYGGTDARTYDRSAYYSPVQYVTAFEPGKTLKANPSYSVLLSKKKPSRKVVLKAGQDLFPGVNYFWVKHPSSRSALREPVCMASLISVPAAKNSLGRDILLFSNPDSDKHRHRMTIKASLDGGLTWNGGIMLDEEGSWGYSCLTLVDADTVGILYESSVANITFQAVSLEEVVAAP